MYDIIIKNGTIIDGSGKPMFHADLGIREGKIAHIGDLKNDHAETEIDATRKYVTPGFIDVNNHSDTYWRIFLDPTLESLLYQGVTTIVGGNCGSSLAPLASHEVIKSIQKWTDLKNVSFNWLSMKEFFDEVGKKNLALNFASLVGHETLRRGLVGDEVRDISPAEMEVMKKMLTRAMKEGALGFSTGLVYTHAKLASSREIAELAEIVKKYDGVYATHIRGEGHELLRSIEEAIRIAENTGVRLQISHLKAMGAENWHLMEEALTLIETARTNGIDVHFDVYPYTATGSVLYILLPDWATEGGRNMMLSRLKDPEIRQRIIKEMRESAFDYSKIIISISALDKTLNHKRITEIAKLQRKSIEDAIIDLLIASEGRVITVMEVLSEKNVDKSVVNPFSIISSNGSGYDIAHEKTGEMVHPRNFGSFPRVFTKYVKKRGVVGWEEAVHKMSGLPAKKFKIEKRGIIAEGNHADIVVLNPESVCDMATIENPYRYSQGMEWVIVNGKPAVKNGIITNLLSGEVVKRKSSLFEF
jgi:N-acyl-D-amino-acid deacylase